jgi:hypothetical protein
VLRTSLLALFVTALAGCSCSSAPVTPDTGGRSDAPTLDAPVAIDVPVTLDAPAAIDAPSALDAVVTDDVPATTDDAPSTTDASSTADAPSALDAPATTDAPMDAPRADAPTPIRVTIVDPYVYGNCFPVPPDPVIAGWDVSISGASGSTATLTSAVLTVMGPATFTQTLAIDSPVVTLSGGAGTGSMRKTGGNPASVPGCGSFCSGSGAPAIWKIDMVFRIDGADIAVTVMGDYSCVV